MVSKKNPILLALILLFATLLWCQPQSTTVTLKGVVPETTLLSNNNLHVWLQDGQAGSEVCLGPASFLEGQGLRPEVGDRIEVTGMRVAGGSLLVAHSLQMAGKNLQLRGPSRASGYAGGQRHGLRRLWRRALLQPSSRRLLRP
jgi:hypothetical protein